MTLLPMQQHVVPNHTLKSLIVLWQEEQGGLAQPQPDGCANASSTCAQ